MAQGFTHPEYLVDTGWLAAHLADVDVRVLDCTMHLPALPDNSYYTVRAGREEFLQSHIPRSAFVDMDGEVADADAPYHFMLPSAEKFAEVMAALGIDRNTLVVSYSAANHWWASRMWWMLRVFGHDRAAVLDGGFQKWQNEGRPVESGDAVPVARREFEPRPARRELIATREDVLAAIGAKDVCTINALRPEQHAGTGDVYYGRRGHIKGSVNLAAAATVDDNNVYRSAPELRRQFAEPLSKPAVIAYCGGGIAASADTLVLAMLGYENVKLYDASLSEWARDPALPMEI